MPAVNASRWGEGTSTGGFLRLGHYALSMLGTRVNDFNQAAGFSEWFRDLLVGR